VSTGSLAGWTPIRLFWPEGQPHVDWCRLGTDRFIEPFFDQTIADALRTPARMLFRRTTSVEVLERMGEEQRGVPPKGFIFHLSRCGSTLVAQMLASLERNIVISEAPPLDQVVSAHWRDPRVTREQRIRWFRGMVNALGQKRRGAEEHFYIKFDCWHSLELPMILEAFPEVPWIFVYRDPVEVMVSHQRQRGSQMIPGVLDPRMFGIGAEELSGMSLDEYCARVLEAIGRAALENAGRGRGRLINFNQLPAEVWETLGEFFGREWSAVERESLYRASLVDAKRPSQPHVDDRGAKQREASEEVRRLAAQWMGGIYAQLEAARAASASNRSRSQSFTTQSITR
jgi:hypothetical protein